MSTDPKELAAAFRVLANLIDEHPKIAGWFRHPYFGEHLTADEAADLDGFVEVFEAPMNYRDHANGTRFMFAETTLGPLVLHLQCYTEDYEKATGKTVDNTAVTA
ncbi:hypothetical protein ACWEOE_10705 [Amycolatopsis sp. NPDC004368]